MSRGINLRTLRTAHLYADGHAVLQHEDTIEMKGRPTVVQKWAEVFERLSPPIEGVTGRMDVSGKLLNALRKVDSIKLENGSLMATKEGWALQAMSEGFTVENDYSQTYEDVSEIETIDGLAVTRRHPIRVKATKVEDAVTE